MIKCRTLPVLVLLTTVCEEPEVLDAMRVGALGVRSAGLVSAMLRSFYGEESAALTTADPKAWGLDKACFCVCVLCLCMSLCVWLRMYLFVCPCVCICEGVCVCVLVCDQSWVLRIKTGVLRAGSALLKQQLLGSIGILFFFFFSGKAILFYLYQRKIKLRVPSRVI